MNRLYTHIRADIIINIERDMLETPPRNLDGFFVPNLHKITCEREKLIVINFLEINRY